MEHLNWGYIQLGLVALVFGGLQVWWISNVLWRRDLAKPQSGGEFRKSLERIWKKEQQSLFVKKSLTDSTPPGTYPVAHDDQPTLVSIYTHAMEWLPKVFRWIHSKHLTHPQNTTQPLIPAEQPIWSSVY